MPNASGLVIFERLGARIRGVRSRVRPRSPRQPATGHFLVSHEFKYIYCPIPKVACTSFKTLMLESESTADAPAHTGGEPNRDLHRLAAQSFGMSRYEPAHRSVLLEDPEFFRFVIVRNPWSRLASAYIDKFVRPESLEDFALHVIEQVCHLRGGVVNSGKGISFREFVGYVARHRNVELNDHWMPQTTFLAGVRFDFIGRFENLERDYQVIKSRTGLTLDLPKRNRLEYVEAEVPVGGLADARPYELRRLAVFPEYTAFYTPELVRTVAKRYRTDVKAFRYTFGAG